MPPEEFGKNVKVDGERAFFYCPVYEAYIDWCDCSEIRCGIRKGYYYNDGIGYLMDITLALAREGRCLDCARL